MMGHLVKEPLADNTQAQDSGQTKSESQPFCHSCDLGKYLISLTDLYFFFQFKMSTKIVSIKFEVKVLVTQSFPTLCKPMDCSPPGSSWNSPGILQEKNTGVGCYFLLQGIKSLR